MKKQVFLIFLLTLIIATANAITVDRQMISATDAGKTVDITFLINPEQVQNFELTDAIPVEWTVISWDVQGISKETVVFSTTTSGFPGEQQQILKWNFQGAINQIMLTYSVKANTVGEQKLTALWKYEGTFSSSESEIFVRSVGAVCGNNICESAYGENNFTCPADCRFQFNPYFWLALLLLATIIVISGIAYREYKAYKYFAKKTKPMPKPEPKQPEKVIHFEMKHKPLFAPAFKTAEKKPIEKTELKKETKTVKASKTKAVKTVKSKPKAKPKKQKKPAKRAPKKDRHEKFYKQTLSKLEKIKKELK